MPIPNRSLHTGSSQGRRWVAARLPDFSRRMCARQHVGEIQCRARRPETEIARLWGVTSGLVPCHHRPFLRSSGQRGLSARREDRRAAFRPCLCGHDHARCRYELADLSARHPSDKFAGSKKGVVVVSPGRARRHQDNLAASSPTRNSRWLRSAMISHSIWSAPCGSIPGPRQHPPVADAVRSWHGDVPAEQLLYVDTDPAIADTAVFVEHHGADLLDSSANCVVVAGKRGGERPSPHAWSSPGPGSTSTASYASNSAPARLRSPPWTSPPARRPWSTEASPRSGSPRTGPCWSTPRSSTPSGCSSAADGAAES